MTADELRLLLDYHYWARNRLLVVVDALTPEQFARDMGSSFRSIRDTLHHLCVTEWVWHQRLTGYSPGTPPHAADAFADVSSIRRLWAEEESKLRRLADSLTEEDLNHEIAYRMMSGQAARSRIWEMLQHVVNHGSYHRGQVTTMLRQVGGSPPASMDLIAFYRDRSR